MTKYVVTGKKPFYGPDCKSYPPGSIVNLIDFQEVEDADGNKKTIGMKPGRFLKPAGTKGGAAAASSSAKGRTT
jgi:hypothetical protein